jgi:hypothetical protein
VQRGVCISLIPFSNFASLLLFASTDQCLNRAAIRVLGEHLSCAGIVVALDLIRWPRFEQHLTLSYRIILPIFPSQIGAQVYSCDTASCPRGVTVG